MGGVFGERYSAAVWGLDVLMAHASSAVTARPPVQASPVARSLMTAFSTWPVAFRLSMYACEVIGAVNTCELFSAAHS